MSNLHNVHDFKPFNAKTSKAFESQRLAKACYKKSKKSKQKFQSICVSIPQIVASLDSDLLPVIQERLEHAQDGIVRSMHESGKTAVSDSDISLTACISFLTAELEGERVTKEDVESWFSEAVEEILVVALAEKVGVQNDSPTEQQQNLISGNVAVYREKFCALAGGRTIYDAETAQKLEKVLELSDSSDAMTERFVKRLKKMQVKEVNDLLAL